MSTSPHRARALLPRHRFPRHRLHWYVCPPSTLTSTSQLTYWSLKFPPDMLRILAQYQASGLLSPLLNSLPQPTPSRRPAALLHPQPTVPKSRRPSARPRGVPILNPGSAPRPAKATRYQPPPVKARARRAALAKSRARQATTYSIHDGQANSAGASKICTKSLSMPALRTEQWIAERAKQISQSPGLHCLPVPLIKECLAKMMGITAEDQQPRSNNSRVTDAGAPSSRLEASNRLAVQENLSPPVVEMPEKGVLPAPHSSELPGSSVQTKKPQSFPPVERVESASTTATGFPEWWSMSDLPPWMTLLLETSPTSEVEDPARKAIPSVATVQGQNVEADPSAVLESILNFMGSSVMEAGRSETEIAPTHEDSMSLRAPPNNLGRNPGADNIWVGEQREFPSGLLDENWEEFVNFDYPNKV
ncbi:hypothetical protein BC826DRAFT_1001309 [Russula brevipes]|nr:hypothetical protein BC826DRAFT_1001309 [Russula brevipes]